MPKEAALVCVVFSTFWKQITHSVLLYLTLILNMTLSPQNNELPDLEVHVVHRMCDHTD